MPRSLIYLIRSFTVYDIDYCIKMGYATEHIANILMAARVSKGLSQRELSALSGVPQGHISKIENGAVDLRVSSLVELARALDLELMLVPQKSVAAVQAVVRGREHAAEKSDETSQQVSKELKRLQNSLATLSKTGSFAVEIAQLDRQVRDLQNFRLARIDPEMLRVVHREVKMLKENTVDLGAIRQIGSHFRKLRNSLAHSSVKVPQIDEPRPAYRLDEDDNG